MQKKYFEVLEQLGLQDTPSERLMWLCLNLQERVSALEGRHAEQLPELAITERTFEVFREAFMPDPREKP